MPPTAWAEHATDEAGRSADLDRHDETCHEAEQTQNGRANDYSVSIDASPSR